MSSIASIVNDATENTIGIPGTYITHEGDDAVAGMIVPLDSMMTSSGQPLGLSHITGTAVNNIEAAITMILIVSGLPEPIAESVSVTPVDGGFDARIGIPDDSPGEVKDFITLVALPFWNAVTTVSKNCD